MILGFLPKWLAALLASSFTFALADVLCDICSARSPPCAAQPESLFTPVPLLP